MAALRRLAFVGLVTCLALGVLTYALLPTAINYLPGKQVSVTNIQPEIGKAYTAKLGDPSLSDHERPSPARLYLIDTRPGSALHHLSPILGGSFVFEWLKSLVDANYPNATHEVRTPLGPPHAPHADIRATGGGQYSIWQGYVYFSLPPERGITSTTRLEVFTPLLPALTDPVSVQRVKTFAGGVALAAATCLGLGLIGRLLASVFRRTRLLRNLIPGIATTVFMLAAIAVAGEFYMRATGYFPKEKNHWPTEFVPSIGWRFQPGAEIRSTNGVSYWTVTRANSIGFLDKEPAIPKPPGTFRVLVVGDSFIENVRVNLEDRLQTVLAKKIEQEMPGKKIDIVALGYSGTGQSNQLPWYAFYKDQLKPDIVVLVFVANDFANNSGLLESVRNGWSPDHAPRLFFRKNADGTCSRDPIDPDWERHVMRGNYTERLERLRQLSPDYKDRFAGWNPTEQDARGLDFVFYDMTPLPPVFEEAIDLTRCSFAEWKSQIEKDGIRLVAILAENVEAGRPANPGEPKQNGQMIRISSILDELRIPWLNLYPEFVKRGNPKDAIVQFDGHWNRTGNKWAADVEPAGFRPRGRDELGQCLEAFPGRDDQHVRHTADRADGDEVLSHVVAETGIDRRRDGVRRRIDQQRVAVRIGLRDHR